jgi:hypothetical protein
LRQPFSSCFYRPGTRLILSDRRADYYLILFRFCLFNDVYPFLSVHYTNNYCNDGNCKQDNNRGSTHFVPPSCWWLETRVQPVTSLQVGKSINRLSRISPAFAMKQITVTAQTLIYP